MRKFKSNELFFICDHAWTPHINIITSMSRSAPSNDESKKMKNLKVQLFKSAVVTVLLYAWNIWPFNQITDKNTKMKLTFDN